MSKIKTVLFDFDGTLMDTTDIIVQSWQQVYLKVRGEEEDERVILDTFGTMLAAELDKVFPGHDREELLKIYRGYQEDKFLDMISLYPGIREMLDELKGRAENIALVTSRLKPTTMQAVNEFGLDEYFDVMVTASDCTAHKPDPQPILMALEQLGVSPGPDVLMVGDTLPDRKCARNAGVSCALVSWAPAIDVHALNDEDAPEYILEKPSDIFKVL